VSNACNWRPTTPQMLRSILPSRPPITAIHHGHPSRPSGRRRAIDGGGAVCTDEAR
jgi:hypothetical protein